ncbi:hypothetical protein PoB_003884400 [Plakobranchus ocellatus]|uniref:Secreted protein n=1 Tax=Plakobranchus ocellatus TaxID=259542 RepID=A0AAV4B0X2_9GAST|nr:hypothetical protein PoB_003884400 [Plakobranchus ocellatus]
MQALLCRSLSYKFFLVSGIGGTVNSEPALRFASILLSRIRVPLLWPGRWPESLRSPYSGLAIHTNTTAFSVGRDFCGSEQGSQGLCAVRGNVVHNWIY